MNGKRTTVIEEWSMDSKDPRRQVGRVGPSTSVVLAQLLCLAPLKSQTRGFKDAMAATSSFQKMKARMELVHWVDVFHNTEPERAPSKIGCCLTMLMVPVILVYAVVWFTEHQRMPPTETLVIDWSVAYGPFPMKVPLVHFAKGY